MIGSIGHSLGASASPRRNGDGSTGPLYARFRYDALGRRISACYDEVGANGDLTNDWIEFYAYDPAWRLTCVYRQGPEDPWGQRSPGAPTSARRSCATRRGACRG